MMKEEAEAKKVAIQRRKSTISGAVGVSKQLSNMNQLKIHPMDNAEMRVEPTVV
jgi:hypothetical protein